MNTTIKFRPHSLALALLVMTTACHSSSPSASAAEAQDPATLEAQQAREKEEAARIYTQTKHLLALDERCNWLTPIDRLTVTATNAERRAWLLWQDESLEEADAKADTIIEQEKAIVCDDNGARSIWMSVGYIAWQMRATWALRADALLDGPQRPEWFKGRSSVADHRDSIKASIEGLKALDADGVERGFADITKEAEQMLAVARCPASEQGCPATTADKALSDYAQVWVEYSEAYAEALSGEADKVGKPSEPPPMP